MITIYAEKFDVGVKIAAALGGFDYNGTMVTMNNVEKLKTNLEKDVKRKGVIYINYEGKNYAVTWGQGHMCSLKQAKDYDETYKNWKNMPIPFFPTNYEIKIREEIDRTTRKPTGNDDPWTSRQLSLVKSLFEKSEYIINATDDDREGEVIFAYVYEYLDVDVPYKRVVLDSQTEEGFRKAFRNLKDSSEVKPIENAGRGRSQADWLVGANLTAAMSLKYGGSGSDAVISLGRVQTPVLNILVTRELEILNFKSHPFWYVTATFKTSKGEEYSAKHEIAQIEDKAKAQELFNKVNGKQGTVADFTKEKTSKEVPLLYNLTNLSQAANKAYGYTAQETLNLAQQLYEKGYTTYPRTPSTCLTDDMKDTVDEVLDMLRTYNDDYKTWIDAVPKAERNYTKRHFNTKKVDSHYAIIPTKVKPENMTADQKNLYDLIAKSVIRIIYKSAIGEKTEITTVVEDEKFKSSGTIMVDPQWLVVGDSSSKDNLLPNLSIGEKVDGSYEFKEGKTNPPQRYNDDTLLTAMKTAGKKLEDEELKAIMESECDGGIGTEATRAGIIETVIQRKYAERKGNGKTKQIVPTEKGMKVIELLPLKEIKSAELTADWEMRLNKIAKSEDSLKSFISDMEEITSKWVDEIKNAKIEATLGAPADNMLPVNCPKCGKPMKKLSWGWACSGYSKDDPSACKFAVGYNLGGAKITDKDIDDIITKGRSKYINGFKKKDSNETYGAFVVLDENKNLTRSWDTGLTCPVCGNGHVMVKKGNWGCSEWQSGCKFTLWDTQFGKTISDKDKTDLITKKKTKEIKGFVSKAKGTTYDGFLTLNDDGTVKMNFAEKKKK